MEVLQRQLLLRARASCVPRLSSRTLFAQVPQSRRCAPLIPCRSLSTPKPKNTPLPPPPPAPQPSHRLKAFTAAICGVGLVAAALSYSSLVHAEAPPVSEVAEEPEDSGDSEDPSKRRIRLAEVKQHGRDSTSPWIVRGIRVYDITEWIPIHPGGDVIWRGAGGSVEAYWKIFTIHQKQEVYDMLEEYFIGTIDDRDLVDGQVPQENIDDPFKNDPKRDSRLKALTQRPCNAETPGPDLCDFITPNELFYVRNHMWVPEVDNPDEHKLTIEMADGEEVEYTLQELKAKFKPFTVTAVLQCSGNRRSHMTAAARHTNGLQWDVGAIGNAEWTGVRLRDVLADAGLNVDDLPEDVKHAQFMGSEAYGASIPIEKAVDKHGDVLLAYEMNGKPLPRDHGYPLRVLVPGNVAARSVKWLTKVTLSEEESWSQWQRRDYKCFGPNEGSKPNWDAAVSIQEMPVQSAITCIRTIRAHTDPTDKKPKAYPYNGGEADAVALEGYAFSGGGRRIVRVDVSWDGGQTWDQAEFVGGELKGSKSWGWQRWRFAIPREKVGKCFLVKAIDESYNTQPDSFESHYNYRGNLASGWHRIPYEQPE